MSGRWFRFYSAAMRDPKVAKLSDKQFRLKMMAAFDGVENEFSRHLKGPYERPLSNEWRELRGAVFERDDYTCTYCGERGGKLECDHIHPVCKGGGHDLENLTTACWSCNRAKAGKTLSEWRPN